MKNYTPYIAMEHGTAKEQIRQKLSVHCSFEQ